MKNRKHLFKAKTTEGKWIYGLPLEKNDKFYIIDLENTSNLTEVLKDSLSEFTNRYMDDEKTEIYENDIIYYREQYWTIQYCPALTGFQAVCYDEDNDFNCFLPITQVIEGTIKGNIIDNPNLVKVKLE